MQTSAFRFTRSAIGKRVRDAAVAAAVIVGMQPAAWAVCADGTTFPPGGYALGQPAVTNWTPGIFTETEGSLFIPDN